MIKKLGHVYPDWVHSEIDQSSVFSDSSRKLLITAVSTSAESCQGGFRVHYRWPQQVRAKFWAYVCVWKPIVLQRRMPSRILSQTGSTLNMSPLGKGVCRRKPTVILLPSFKAASDSIKGKSIRW